jgi:phosphopantothenoylcysteine decarboxylase/phosphopantothenate--cysteine ligase
MGYALAEQALRRGAKVLLVSGPTALTPPGAAELAWVESSDQMYEAVIERLPQSTIVIKTAAVSDYRPARVASEKIKRAGPTTLELRPTVDILAAVVARKQTQLVVGFAAETENVLENARKKLIAKSLDAIVVNDVSREGIGFDSDQNLVTILTEHEVVEVPQGSKREVAQGVLDQVVKLRQLQRLSLHSGGSRP